MSAPKRKRFWIDPSTQLKILAFVLGLLAVSLVLCWLSVDRGLEQTAGELHRQYIPIDWARAALRGPFFFSGAIILLGGAMVTLLWSHRFVGPILVVTAGLRRIQDGNLKGEVRIRDTDALRETVNDFCAMQAALRRHVGEDRERVAAIEQRLAHLADKLDGNASARRELESIRDEVKKLTAFFQL
ncbi:MAG: methyl-accepting chemotaxis protein [Elusimicrobia bacterium]|nr:methyl-accepting chemotaxis protein [Elusimicrobiota bacterium]